MSSSDQQGVEYIDLPESPHLNRLTFRVMTDFQEVGQLRRQDPEVARLWAQYVDWNFDRVGPEPSLLGFTALPGEKEKTQLYQRHTAMLDTYFTLIDISTYIRHISLDNPSVSPIGALHYHVTNFPQNAYILRERLDKYRKMIDVTGAGQRKDEVAGTLKKIRVHVEEKLQHLTEERANHVHHFPFNDHSFQRLRWLASVLRSNTTSEQHLNRQIVHDEFGRMQDHWLRVLAAESTKIRSVVEWFALQIFDVLYDHDEKLRTELVKVE